MAEGLVKGGIGAYNRSLLNSQTGELQKEMEFVEKVKAGIRTGITDTQRTMEENNRLIASKTELIEKQNELIAAEEEELGRCVKALEPKIRELTEAKAELEKDREEQKQLMSKSAADVKAENPELTDAQAKARAVNESSKMRKVIAWKEGELAKLKAATDALESSRNDTEAKLDDLKKETARLSDEADALTLKNRSLEVKGEALVDAMDKELEPYGRELAEHMAGLRSFSKLSDAALATKVVRPFPEKPHRYARFQSLMHQTPEVEKLPREAREKAGFALIDVATFYSISEMTVKGWKFVRAEEKAPEAPPSKFGADKTLTREEFTEVENQLKKGLEEKPREVLKPLPVPVRPPVLNVPVKPAGTAEPPFPLPLIKLAEEKKKAEEKPVPAGGWGGGTMVTTGKVAKEVLVPEVTKHPIAFEDGKFKTTLKVGAIDASVGFTGNLESVEFNGVDKAEKIAWEYEHTGEASLIKRTKDGRAVSLLVEVAVDTLTGSPYLDENGKQYLIRTVEDVDSKTVENGKDGSITLYLKNAAGNWESRAVLKQGEEPSKKFMEYFQLHKVERARLWGALDHIESGLFPKLADITGSDAFQRYVSRELRQERLLEPTQYTTLEDMKASLLVHPSFSGAAVENFDAAAGRARELRAYFDQLPEEHRIIADRKQIDHIMEFARRNEEGSEFSHMKHLGKHTGHVDPIGRYILQMPKNAKVVETLHTFTEALKGDNAKPMDSKSRDEISEDLKTEGEKVVKQTNTILDAVGSLNAQLTKYQEERLGERKMFKSHLTRAYLRVKVALYENPEPMRNAKAKKDILGYLDGWRMGDLVRPLLDPHYSIYVVPRETYLKEIKDLFSESKVPALKETGAKTPIAAVEPIAPNTAAWLETKGVTELRRVDEKEFYVNRYSPRIKDTIVALDSEGLPREVFDRKKPLRESKSIFYDFRKANALDLIYYERWQRRIKPKIAKPGDESWKAANELRIRADAVKAAIQREADEVRKIWKPMNASHQRGLVEIAFDLFGTRRKLEDIQLDENKVLKPTDAASLAAVAEAVQVAVGEVAERHTAVTLAVTTDAKSRWEWRRLSATQQADVLKNSIENAESGRGLYLMKPDATTKTLDSDSLKAIGFYVTEEIAAEMTAFNSYLTHFVREVKGKGDTTEKTEVNLKFRHPIDSYHARKLAVLIDRYEMREPLDTMKVVLVENMRDLHKDVGAALLKYTQEKKPKVKGYLEDINRRIKAKEEITSPSSEVIKKTQLGETEDRIDEATHELKSPETGAFRRMRLRSDLSDLRREKAKTEAELLIFKLGISAKAEWSAWDERAFFVYSEKNMKVLCPTNEHPTHTLVSMQPGGMQFTVDINPEGKAVEPVTADNENGLEIGLKKGARNIVVGDSDGTIILKAENFADLAGLKTYKEDDIGESACTGYPRSVAGMSGTSVAYYPIEPIGKAGAPLPAEQQRQLHKAAVEFGKQYKTIAELAKKITDKDFEITAELELPGAKAKKVEKPEEAKPGETKPEEATAPLSKELKKLKTQIDNLKARASETNAVSSWYSVHVLTQKYRMTQVREEFGGEFDSKLKWSRFANRPYFDYKGMTVMPACKDNETHRITFSSLWNLSKVDIAVDKNGALTSIDIAMDLSHAKMGVTKDGSIALDDGRFIAYKKGMGVADLKLDTDIEIARFSKDGLMHRKGDEFGESNKVVMNALALGFKDKWADISLVVKRLTGEDAKITALIEVPPKIIVAPPKPSEGTAGKKKFVEVAPPISRETETTEETHEEKKIDGKTARNWVSEGLKAGTASDYDKSLAAFENALKLNPILEEALFHKGNALVELNKPDEALDAYNKLIGINPKQKSVYSRKAVALEKMGRIPEALEAVNKGLAINPEDEALRTNAARLEKIKSAEEKSEEKKDEQIESIRNAFKSRSSELDDVERKIREAFASERIDEKRANELQKKVEVYRELIRVDSELKIETFDEKDRRDLLKGITGMGDSIRKMNEELVALLGAKVEAPVKPEEKKEAAGAKEETKPAEEKKEEKPAINVGTQENFNSMANAIADMMRKTDVLIMEATVTNRLNDEEKKKYDDLQSGRRTALENLRQFVKDAPDDVKTNLTKLESLQGVVKGTHDELAEIMAKGEAKPKPTLTEEKRNEVSAKMDRPAPVHYDTGVERLKLAEADAAKLLPGMRFDEPIAIPKAGDKGPNSLSGLHSLPRYLREKKVDRLERVNYSDFSTIHPFIKSAEAVLAIGLAKNGELKLLLLKDGDLARITEPTPQDLEDYKKMEDKKIAKK